MRLLRTDTKYILNKYVNLSTQRVFYRQKKRKKLLYIKAVSKFLNILKAFTSLAAPTQQRLKLSDTLFVPITKMRRKMPGVHIRRDFHIRLFSCLLSLTKNFVFLFVHYVKHAINRYWADDAINFHRLPLNLE